MKDEFFTSCDKISELISRSNGTEIDFKNAEKAKFHLIKKYTQKEIEEYESDTKTLLPDDYKYFLTHVGACHIYYEEYYGGVRFHELKNIEEYSNEVFGDERYFFPKLFLIGFLSAGEQIGFNLGRDKDKNFMVFFSDEAVEDWPASEDREWSTFEEWLIFLVKNNGEKTIM